MGIRCIAARSILPDASSGNVSRMVPAGGTRCSGNRVRSQSRSCSQVSAGSSLAQ
ncbi:Uncharacterised protein [Mycobacteroides abscessus subsp. abscessus]|nr:Uncharacterised protein [Mycobacteroides abscessus subsp. abscessus]